MRLSDLQDKDIVNIEDGTNIGNIIDVVVNKDGKIKSFIVHKNKFLNNIFSNKTEIEVSWEQIKKIGEDVILVNIVNFK